MGEIHRLILSHGRDKARDMVPVSQRRLIDVAAEVMAEDAQSLGITYSGWCMTALPHKRLPDDQPWSRSGYRCTLLVEPGRLQIGRGRPVLFGVPYGARARLILLYLQTEAVRRESREVSLGRSMRDWMTRMGLSVGGETARGLRDQAHRIAASSIKFFWESKTEEATGMARGNIVEQGLFFGEATRAGEASLFEDRVVLSEMFYREIMEHGVPLLDRAIRELRDRSMAIDVYVWLAYKLHVLQGRTPLRWPALYAQFGAGFATIKNFRPSFLDALAAATAAYPDAQVTLEEEGIALHPSPPPIPYRGGGQTRRISAG